MSILTLMLQRPIADNHSSRDKALDREDGSQLLAVSARNDAIVFRGVYNVAIDTSAETRKLEGKLDTLVNLVTHLAANHKPASLQFSAGNDVIVIRGVHDVAIDTSADTRKLEALVNLVTQRAVNQKPASVARVCDIRSSNDHHTSVCPSSRSNLEWMSMLRLMLQTPIADHHSSKDKALDREDGSQLLAFQCKNYAIVIRGVHDVATDTSAETRKLEGKLDTLDNLVTQLAENQKPGSVARVYSIRYSNDHHCSVCPSSQQSGVYEHVEAYAANTYSRPPQQQRQGT
ncbi:hypothetical protein Fmac_032821 [Flemingia macrophylla]|uniref:Uncharacterized protein n=1 Tax=Flemingia macrophylla TaxID=520843 RepID=A0ABD1L604_9FABA